MGIVMVYSRTELNKTKSTPNRRKWVHPAVKQLRAGAAEGTGGITTDGAQS